MEKPPAFVRHGPCNSFPVLLCIPIETTSISRFIVNIYLQVIPEKREEFLQTLRGLMAILEKERGCKKATLYQDLDNVNRFNFIEEWKTDEDLERHLNSEEFKVLFGALKVLCNYSEVTYNMVNLIKRKVALYP
jgi:quinol monooxygenase YgiN